MSLWYEGGQEISHSQSVFFYGLTVCFILGDSAAQVFYFLLDSNESDGLDLVFS